MSHAINWLWRAERNSDHYPIKIAPCQINAEWSDFVNLFLVMLFQQKIKYKQKSATI